jgi:NADPH:quinone reductase-like Zn-dependent oxidoreductase
MQAVVYEQYGPPEVLQFKEVATPVPRDHEVRIRIHATTVTSADWRMRSLTVPVGFKVIFRLVLGISKPKKPILGSELAGVIDAIGKDVRSFKVGDPVFAFSDMALGCHAEYTCLSEQAAIAHKPAQLSYTEAAALSFGGMTMLDFFRRAQLKPGESVLVHGASGAVGTAAVQLARHFGAEVTGVCSGANVELVRSLGAQQVIDYTQADFAHNGKTYDVIVDTVGTAPFARSKGSLKPGGRLLSVIAGLPEMLKSPWFSLTSGKKVIAGPSTTRPQDMHVLAELAAAGAFKPVIDRCYPFAEIVAAHRHVDTGRKKGNVVITLVDDAPAF